MVRKERASCSVVVVGARSWGRPARHRSRYSAGPSCRMLAPSVFFFSRIWLQASLQHALRVCFCRPPTHPQMHALWSMCSAGCGHRSRGCGCVMAQAKERAPCNYSAPSSVAALEPPWRARSVTALAETFTAAFQRPRSPVACGKQRWVSLWAWSEPGHHPEPLKTFSQQINTKKRSRQSGNGVFASLLFACSAHSPSFANPDQVVFCVLLPVLCCLFLFFVPIHIGDLGPVFRLAHRHAHPTAFPKYLILCPPILAFDSASSHFPIHYILSLHTFCALDTSTGSSQSFVYILRFSLCRNALLSFACALVYLDVDQHAPPFAAKGTTTFVAIRPRVWLGRFLVYISKLFDITTTALLRC